MGACESINSQNKKNNKRSNIGKQPYSAPIKNNYDNDDNTTNLGTTINTISQIDDLTYNNEFNRRGPSGLYKYNGTYYKKGEQISLMTVSLHQLQENSLLNNRSRTNRSINNNSIYNTCIDETENESSSNDVLEIIYDGKMDENMVHKSTDKTTMENYNEFIGKKDKSLKNNKIDIYNRRKCVKEDINKENNKICENDDNKDGESNTSGISSNSFNNIKYGKKNII